MTEPRLLIIGGGLAGLSAGCHARRSGYSTTIVEHNLSLGGVCTAWHRGSYLIDGCIHWLTGGPFLRLYEEIGILPAVSLRTIEHFVTYRDARGGVEIPVTRDLDALFRRLTELAPEDATELARMRQAVSEIGQMSPGLEAQELESVRDRLHAFWEIRGSLGSVVHFRKSLGEWMHERISSEVLRKFFVTLAPEPGPALFLLMVLGYLEKGYLSRPVGGTERFRDALEAEYRSLGGAALLHSTVDEVLTEGGRATGVRLADGTMLDADVVLSTASTPETIFRFLGGRYGAEALRKRLGEAPLFEPIVLASFGVSRRFEEVPTTLIVDGIKPFLLGGRANDRLYVRTYHDDPAFAPEGHTVVQTMLPTTYDWWAHRGSRYGAEKDAAAGELIEQLSPYFHGIRDCVRMVDIATPLTFWSMARSWRGAFEGWMPTPEAFFGHLSKTLPGLGGFYMAGQWVEPGGGVPMAVMSGRQAVQLICAEASRPFITK